MISCLLDVFSGRLARDERVDDRGWSLADHLLAVDEGSPGVPMPVGNAAQQDYKTCYKGCNKDLPL